MFIGTKIIEAQPMTRQAYNDFRGWTLPVDEDGSDEGYLVEHTDGGKPNVEGCAGYVSWSPKEQFERAYRSISAMTFGLAVEALKHGKKVARSGWNGKGQYVRLIPSWTYTDGVDDNRKCNPIMGITTVDGSVLSWVPSCPDTLAEDWRIIE